jgi:hypothetical protein
LRQYSVAPRFLNGFDVKVEPLPSGESAYIITGGVSVNVRGAGGLAFLDVEADRAVIWSKSGLSQQMFDNLRRPEGESSRELEFYFSGNVELRSQSPARPGIPEGETRTIRADEIYYDASRNVAIALQADLEMTRKGLPDPIHVHAQEIRQLAPDLFEADRAEVYSSRTPADPGLDIYFASATIEDKRVPKLSLFGQRFVNRTTGAEEFETQSIVSGRNVFIEGEGVPFFYTPYLKCNARDPLGPVENIGFGYNKIMGFQFSVGLNVYDLLGVDPYAGTKWKLDVDYLSARGPALGTEFTYNGKDLFGVPGRYVGFVSAWGIHDTGTDNLGGGRGPDDNHPDWRGRVLWRQGIYDLPAGFTLQNQLSLLSDHNFLEQYYKLQFDQDYDQKTYLYLKQQQDQWAWNFIVEPRLHPWVTETEWLPRVDGYWLGQPLFDVFTYNASASLAYAQLKTSNLDVPQVSPTDRNDDTGRLDFRQELSLPFYAGPVKLAPYGVLDLTGYTQDLNGDSVGRVYGGGGVRASLPLSRLYDMDSLLFNLHGLYHKIVLGANYFIAGSSVSYSKLPQLDRLNDDATNQALQDIRPLEPIYNPAHGLALATSPLYDPQVYAIRRLLQNRIDTLDDIQELQFDVRQRWQTKRGFPGNEHIVDWMTLDLSATVFPAANRDNFGSTFGFLEYDWLWNVGDRTALTSTGWIDPETNGPRVFTVGAYLNRTDRTNFYLGYRQIDPVESKAVTASVNYVFSRKYSLTGTSVYDFGTQQSLANSLLITRTGTDVSITLGLTYNAIQKSFGFTVEVLPNLVALARKPGVPLSLLGGAGPLGR